MKAGYYMAAVLAAPRSRRRAGMRRATGAEYSSSPTGTESRAKFNGPLVILTVLPTLMVFLPSSLGAERTRAVAEEDPAALPARKALMARYPGVHRYGDDQTPLVAVYGRPMTTGHKPDEAVRHWLRDHAAVLGVAQPELRLDEVSEVGHHGLILFTYRQLLDGSPVEDGLVRVVAVGHSPSQVVYVGARLAKLRADGLNASVLPPDQALEIARRQPQSGPLTDWRTPELVVLSRQGRGLSMAPVRAWKVTAVQPDPTRYEAYSFFVHASTGAIVEVLDAVCRVNVRGQVTGDATPGTLPDSPDNTPLEIPLSHARIRAANGNTAYTDAAGEYVISIGTAPQTVLDVDLHGAWVAVHDVQGSGLMLSRTVVRVFPYADFHFNTSPTEFSTAQVNAFVHATGAHNFYKDRQPAFTALDQAVDCHVNVGPGNVCVGAFSAVDLSLFFSRSTDLCANAAYSSVITHEYGHFILNRLGFESPQGAFGEGFADSVSLLVHDDATIGRDLHGPGTYVRDIAAANQPYPCEGEEHTCGQLLAGVWWDIKRALQASLGDVPGLEAARQLFTDWSRITIGGVGDDSAHPETAVEVLVADDDDGDLSTLTPHFAAICAGFGAHNITCPVQDCNANGLSDASDITSGRSLDCTADGIPDECESDCNGNGAADSCDLADGLLPDADGNGVPDVCQETLIVPSAAYPTIQSAIGDAVDGDTVLVAAGLYSGSGNTDLDFGGKALRVSCEEPGECVIDCKGLGRGFNFHRGETGTSVLDGFCITNGSATGASPDGGGIYCFASSPTIQRCTIRGNSSAGSGGGIACFFSSPRIRDCVITGNTARTGGGMGMSRSQPTITRCTVARNQAVSGGGALRAVNDSNPFVESSILWGNDFAGAGEILQHDSVTSVSYSLVRGGWPGVGNLSADPRFVDPDAGDFRLQPGSPAINGGNPTDAVPDEVDAAGRARLQGCRVDMGALESSTLQIQGDFNGDGTWDLRDVAAFQRCYYAEIGNPEWLEVCVCVFDADDDGTISGLDLAAFEQVLAGP